MSDNWGDELKKLTNDFIDRLYKFLGPGDEYEYVSDGVPPVKADVEVHLSVKIKRR